MDRLINNKLLAIFLGAWGLVSCASLEKKVSVAVDQDAQILRVDGSKQDVKKDQTFELGDKAVVIESRGFEPVVLVPVKSDSGKVDVKLHPATAWVGEAFNKSSNKTVSDVVAAIIKAQQQVAQRNYEMALATIEGVQDRHAHVTYINFLKATTLVILNRRQDAQIALEKALIDFPDDADGNKLYESISGKKFQSPGTEVRP